MRTLRNLILPALLVPALCSAGQAVEKKVLVSGDPPLTQEMLDDYGNFAEWRLGPALARMGGAARLAQLIINDWKNGDKARQKAILAELRWWREDFPKLNKADRERLAGTNSNADADRARQAALEAEAIQRLQVQIHMLQLQQWSAATQQQIVALSNLQAKHHETMMIIIGNMRPTGHYEYNPATGRYDRYRP
jgi:hypothetical protein